MKMKLHQQEVKEVNKINNYIIMNKLLNSISKFLFLFLLVTFVSCSRYDVEKEIKKVLGISLKKVDFERIDIGVKEYDIQDFKNEFHYKLTNTAKKNIIQQIESQNLYNYKIVNISEVVKLLKSNKITGFWIKEKSGNYFFLEPNIGVEYSPYNSSLFSNDSYKIESKLDVDENILYYKYTSY